MKQWEWDCCSLWLALPSQALVPSARAAGECLKCKSTKWNPRYKVSSFNSLAGQFLKMPLGVFSFSSHGATSFCPIQSTPSWQSVANILSRWLCFLCNKLVRRQVDQSEQGCRGVHYMHSISKSQTLW